MGLGLHLSPVTLEERLTCGLSIRAVNAVCWQLRWLPVLSHSLSWPAAWPCHAAETGTVSLRCRQSPFSVAPCALISSFFSPVKRDITEGLMARNEQILRFIRGWRWPFSDVCQIRILDRGLIRFTKKIKTFCLFSSKTKTKSKQSQSCRLVVNSCQVIGCHSVLQVYSDSVWGGGVLLSVRVTLITMFLLQSWAQGFNPLHVGYLAWGALSPASRQPLNNNQSHSFLPVFWLLLFSYPLTSFSFSLSK